MLPKNYIQAPIADFQIVHIYGCVQCFFLHTLLFPPWGSMGGCALQHDSLIVWLRVLAGSVLLQRDMPLDHTLGVAMWYYLIDGRHVSHSSGYYHTEL
jgi:hypothetical protein